MDPLDSGEPYKFVPYLPTPPSQDAPPPSFTVLQASTWTYSGPLLSASTLPPSFHSWSTAALSSAPALLERLLPLLSFLETFLRENGVECYWLTLRATTATTEYDTPRWHVDEDFFSGSQSSPDTPSTAEGRWKPWRRRSGTSSRDSKTSKQEEPTTWKLCTTLLGPGTLFLPLPTNSPALTTLHTAKKIESAKRIHTCTSIRCAGCSDTGTAVRHVLAAAFADSPTVQSSYGEVAVFRTGDSGGAVHSEPRCGGDRVFVNVVPGREGELRALMGRFGMEWPRDWSLGVLGGGEGVGSEGVERRT